VSGSPALLLDRVNKRYGSLSALDGLSLTVPQGQIFGLLGPNGSGKTTTINLLCGLLSPTEGRIEVLGRDVVASPRSVRPLLGVVPQETALYGELSAWRNLLFHAELYGVPRARCAERAQRMLELVGLWERRHSPVKTYSGGMRRRLAIARAMLHEPEILYLDEPTLGIDVASRRTVWSYIRHLRSANKTILLTTNYLEEASALCDRVVIIDHGKAVADGTPEELGRRLGGSVLELATEERASPELIAELESLAGVVAVEARDGGLAVTYTEGDANAAEILNAVMARTALTSFAQRHTSLDEVFLRLTGHDHLG